MNKTYIAPAVVSSKVTAASSILVGSYSGENEENLNNVTIDTSTEHQGNNQLVKRENIWDSEW